MLRGIDISGHQDVIRWPELVLERTQFIIIKATGGGTFKNRLYPAQLAAARAAGRLIGHYHYAHELTLTAHQPQGRYSPEQEADHFCNNTDVRPGEVVALDIEDPDVYGNLSEWALRWLARVEERLGFKPMLYSYPNYMQTRGLLNSRLVAYPLWFAYYRVPYNDNAPFPTTPAPFPRIAIWQWSGGTRVRGFDFNTDENLFFGTVEDFKAMGKPETPVQRVPTFQHAPGFIGPPLVDTFDWGGDTAGIIVERQLVVYNDETQKFYRLHWHADRPKQVDIQEVV